MPKINQNLEKELRLLVAEIVEVDEKEIVPESDFVEDLGMDSMMALEIMAAMEKKYKIQIPEDKLGKIRNFKDTLKLVKEYISKKG